MDEIDLNKHSSNVNLILQPGDNLLTPAKPRTSDLVYLEDHYNPELRHKKNVIDTITDKSKDFLSILSGDHPKENVPATADWEKVKADKYAESNIFFPEETVRVSNRDSMPPLAVDESTLSYHDMTVQQALKDKEDGTKLWIGKDYANFIVKDFVSVDSPFVGKKKYF